jgi:hypothetical protein
MVMDSRDELRVGQKTEHHECDEIRSAYEPDFLLVVRFQGCNSPGS